MSPDCPVDPDILRRVQSEFLEMPGLHLTGPQAQRLWGLDRQTCERLLEVLISARFLCRARDGAFRLVTAA
ncbi:MAG TPA: hypothetical protein VND92_11870 [Vicinamibacterales bacterium]|nr:hypothetical protein [Vicinamibacterales bacterium]